MEEKYAAAAAAYERSARRRPPPPRTAPWLVIPHGKGMKHQAFYNVCEPERKTCRKFIPEMSGKSYWQKPSHQGWLVMLSGGVEVDWYSNTNWNYGDCFLWNPVSLETILLPSLLDRFNKSNQYIIDCVLSSPPITSPHNDNDNDNDDDDNSVVFFLFEEIYYEVHKYKHFLVFCRPGVDKQWRTMEISSYIVDKQSVRQLLWVRSKLYVMCLSDRHLEIELQQGHDDDDEETKTLTIRSFNVSNDTFFPTVGGSIFLDKTDYVESSDELFMIIMNYNPRGHMKVVSYIEVLRLNFSLLAWEEVKSLGDHVLFLGENTTASCSTADLGLPRGCLYYTLPQDQSLYIFEVEDNGTTIILPCLELPKPWFSPRWMMMPTTARIEDMFGKVEQEDKISISNYGKENKEQKLNGGELGQATPWGILNEDIVALVASYLHPVDYLHFRAISKANRSIIPAVNWKSHSTRIVKTNTYLSPWLVFSENNDSIYNFIDPMHNNEKYLMNLTELLVGAKIHFSKGGWLLMSKGSETLFFYNPFTGATIQLPDLQALCCFVGMSFSSLPISSDCVVFGFGRWSTYDIAIFVIARGNGVWRSHIFENRDVERYMPCFNNPVFYDGAFYCLDYNGTLGVFNVEDSLWKVLTKPQGHFHALYPSFLVECDGNLLLVDLGHLGKSVGIFRLDFSEMVWVKVESLGKHMLFISNTSCLSAIAPHSGMENRIYFPRLQGEGILFYSLDTGKYHSSASRQYSALDFYNTKDRLNCTWIEPNWLRSTVQELDWLII